MRKSDDTVRDPHRTHRARSASRRNRATHALTDMFRRRSATVSSATTCVLDDLLFDYSKHRINDVTLGASPRSRARSKTRAAREALFAGEHVNTTEYRPALHMALRNFSGRPCWSMATMSCRRSSPSAPKSPLSPRRCARARSRRQGRAFHRYRQYRHRRLRSWPGHGGAALCALCAAGSHDAFRLECRWRRPRRHFERSRSGADAVHRFLEDLHHPGDDDQCAPRALRRRALGERRSPIISPRSRPGSTVAAFGIARRPGVRLLGLGRRTLFDLVVDRPRLTIAIGPEHFEDFLRGGFDVDQHFKKRRSPTIFRS